jgi:hypothetical protein
MNEPGQSKRSVYRLDHFLPFQRASSKPQPKSIATSVRKVLRRIGPTMLAAPLRRVVQTLCFLLFTWLFFYVCWPYHAKPQTPGAMQEGWRLAEFEQTSGGLSLEHDSAAKELRIGQQRFLVDQGIAAGHFNITGIHDKRVRLAPAVPLTAEQIDRVLFGAGPWALHETVPGKWPSHYTDDLARKEIVAAESFLVIDPLVSLSTAIASRSWVWSLVCAGIILAMCVLIPRGFCGYLCPLGTLIDMFDWAIGKRVTRFRVAKDGWWVHIKYYLLLAVLIAAFCGVLISGYVAAIPVITRGMLFIGEPLQSGFTREWHLVPSMNFGHVVSILLFFGVLALGLLKPRFWCKYVCPSGALFSVGNLFRVSERKVESSSAGTSWTSRRRMIRPLARPHSVAEASCRSSLAQASVWLVAEPSPRRPSCGARISMIRMPSAPCVRPAACLSLPSSTCASAVASASKPVPTTCCKPKASSKVSKACGHRW